MPSDITRFPKDGGRMPKGHRWPVTLYADLQAVASNPFSGYENVSEVIFDACAKLLKDLPVPVDLRPYHVANDLAELERYELIKQRDQELYIKCSSLVITDPDKARVMAEHLQPRDKEEILRRLNG